MAYSLFNILFLLNLFNPTAGLEHHKLPEWLDVMDRPALRQLCLDRTKRADKRILAAATLRLKHRDATDFSALADRVDDPVLKRDLMRYAGRTVGKKPVLDDGIPGDILLLPAETRAVFFYSDHFRRGDDDPDRGRLVLPGRFSQMMEMMFFSAIQGTSFFRLDSLTAGAAGTLPGNKFGKASGVITVIARGTFNRKRIMDKLRSGGFMSSLVGGIRIFRKKGVALAFPDGSTALLAGGTEDRDVLQDLQETIRTVRNSRRRLPGNGEMVRILKSHLVKPGYFNIVANGRNLFNDFITRELGSGPISKIAGTEAASFILYDTSKSEFRLRLDHPDRDTRDTLAGIFRDFVRKQIHGIEAAVAPIRNNPEHKKYLRIFGVRGFLDYLGGFRYSTGDGSLVITPEKPCHLSVIQFLSGTIRYLPILIKMAATETKGK